MSDPGPPLTAHLDGAIRDGRHTMQIRVYYEDTDFPCWQYRNSDKGVVSLGRGTKDGIYFDKYGFDAKGRWVILTSRKIWTAKEVEDV